MYVSKVSACEQCPMCIGITADTMLLHIVGFNEEIGGNGSFELKSLRSINTTIV